jgi:hypothetical protein
MIKTFRGILADGGQDQIRLQTIKGKVGYRIVKFQLMPKLPGTVQAENTVKIYTDEQSTIDSTIDFTDSTLLAAGYFVHQTSATLPYFTVVVFDREIFNQDIYVTCKEPIGARDINYYLELEVIPLDDAGAEYTTLKDMRSG